MTKNGEVLNRVRVSDLADLRTDDFGVFDMLRPELERFVAPFKRELLFLGSCPFEWCSFCARRAFRTVPGLYQLAAGRLMIGSSLIVAMVSSVM